MRIDDDGWREVLGNNSYGQLGDNTTINKSTPVDVIGLSGMINISAGYYHNCALTAVGGAKCWVTTILAKSAITQR